MGKTEMLKTMAIQDIQQGHGVGFIDPHGEAAEELLQFVPDKRINEVIYFNPADMKHPIAFNVMENVGPEYRHLVASGLMSVFKKIWPDVWSARMEYILNNAVLALLEYPGSTLLGVNRMLADSDYRQEILSKVEDPVVKTFWLQEYARYTQRYEVEATAAIQNKVGQFISNPLIRNIIGQTRSSIDMRAVMDEQKILIANISKGRVGEDNSRLLGALLVTKLQLAAMSRVDIPEEQRNDFFLYIDEFQNFATDSFVNILSEARKYHLCLVLSHQYIAQLGVGLEAKVRDAVFGNVGTIVSFRIGAEDAEFLEKEFSPEFLQTDFVNLGKYTVYIKLLIDGLASRPFSAQTLPPTPSPFAFPEESNKHVQKIIQASRDTYSTPVEKIEEIIARWSQMDTVVAKAAAMGAAPPPQILYDARCSRCGKDTKVVFPPDGKRPVYCKSCRKRIQREKEMKGAQAEPVKEESSKTPENRPAAPSLTPAPSASKVSLQEAVAKGPVLFHPKQQKKHLEMERPKQVQVNKEELKQVLHDALGAPEKIKIISLEKEEGMPPKENSFPPQTQEKKRGVLKPGETIYF